MRRALTILLLAITIVLNGTNYYVKTGGSDAAAGTSDATAWATTTKVNTEWAAGTFAPGDSILFSRGDTFYGTITVTESGTSGNPIVIGAYGTGDDPIITGFSELTGWSLYSGGIYQASVTGAEAQTNRVLVNGVPVGMGRFPDAGTNLNYTTGTSSTITDPLLNESIDWEGAEVAISKTDWVLDRCLVTDHTGNVITYSNVGYSGLGYIYNNRYYFFQNDLRCVTTSNEWYHNYSTATFYIYGNMSGATVEIATLNYLLYSNGYDYVHVSGLEFRGSIHHAIYFNGSADYCSVTNCTFSHAGGAAMYMYGPDHLTVEGNTVQYCAYGVYTVGDYIDISLNDISYIGMIAGDSFFSHSTAIFINNTNVTVEYNRIAYTAWSGINTSSVATFTIRYNFINYPMQVLDDGGGIYYTSSSGYRLVDRNIVLNSGIGAPADVTIARGIYLDAYSSGSTVSNNIVSGCREAGLHIHAGDNNTVAGNLLYNNGRQVIFQKISGVSENTSFTYNRLICKEASQYSFMSYGYVSSELPGLGSFDNNYYARPIDDDYVFYYNGSHTLADWQTLVYPDDIHSYGSPVAISSTDELHFIYNDTSVSKQYTLSSTMVDIANANYSGTIELTPWTALVLIGDGTVTEGYEPALPSSGEGPLSKDKNGVQLKDKNGQIMIIQ